MENGGRIYAPSEGEGALRQGEVITDLIQIKIAQDSVSNEGSLEGNRVRHPFAIIVSQDCDLVWDFEVRQQRGQKAVPEHRLLPNILFCETSTAESLKGREGITDLCTNT